MLNTTSEIKKIILNDENFRTLLLFIFFACSIDEKSVSSPNSSTDCQDVISYDDSKGDCSTLLSSQNSVLFSNNGDLRRIISNNIPDHSVGAFGNTADYEYNEGLGDLDECYGREGITPEYPSGTYYYVITDSYPGIPRCFVGTPSSDFSIGPLWNYNV